MVSCYILVLCEPQVTSEALNGLEPLTLSKAITKPGFIYVFTSNETDTNLEVYFDDFRVTHSNGLLIGESHYYPFSESIAALSFSMSELEGIPQGDKLGLGWSAMGFRNYDSRIARFYGVDPLGELTLQLSPYQFAGNNPIVDTDILGLTPFTAIDRSNLEDFEKANNTSELSTDPKKRSKGHLTFRTPFLLSPRNKRPSKDAKNKDDNKEDDESEAAKARSEDPIFSVIASQRPGNATTSRGSSTIYTPQVVTRQTPVSVRPNPAPAANPTLLAKQDRTLYKPEKLKRYELEKKGEEDQRKLDAARREEALMLLQLRRAIMFTYNPSVTCYMLCWFSHGEHSLLSEHIQA